MGGDEVKLYDGEINKYFNMHEFACKSDGSIIDNPHVRLFYEMLLEFRLWYNRPIGIESGFRTIKYNKMVGGSPQSQHLKGVAADIHFPTDEDMSFERKSQFLGNVKTKWYDICDKYGIKGGVGFYEWGFHLDARVDKPRSFWDHR